jgi:hypothetical protein
MTRRRARRHVRVPPDLTSLFDVLFIVIFVALIRAAAAQQAAAQAAAPPPKPPPAPVAPAAPSVLRSQAIAQITANLEARPTVIARVTKEGKIRALEAGDKQVALDMPLLEHSPDPDVAIAYLGDRSADLRLCRLLSLHLAIPDLANHLVIVAPDVRSADLPHALYMGLRRDVERCTTDQKGLAVVVEPEPTKATP